MFCQLLQAPQDIWGLFCLEGQEGLCVMFTSSHWSNHIGIILDLSSLNQNRFRILQYKYSLKPAKEKNKTQYWPFLDDLLNRHSHNPSCWIEKKMYFIMLQVDTFLIMLKNTHTQIHNLRKISVDVHAQQLYYSVHFCGVLWCCLKLF